jgi:hypothetical protein
MIIQTAPSQMPRLAIMMYEHNALCLQFAHAFGNDRFEALNPSELMIYVIAHHDAGWFDFDRDPKIDPRLSYLITLQKHRSSSSRLPASSHPSSINAFIPTAA